jgi:hypothetical protein
MRIRIQCGSVSVLVILNETRTAKAVAAALPLISKAQRWGREVYFEVPLRIGEERPQPEVPSGAFAYWDPGPALCLFFGQKPYSPVTVIGTIEGDPNVLDAVSDGDEVRVERVGD